MEHVPLLVFSLCMQASIGIIVFIAVGGFVNKEARFKVPLIAAFALGVVGMLASLMHLGHPELAVKSLTNVATSFLSREIVATGVYVVLALASLIAIFIPRMSRIVTRVLSCAAVIAGMCELAFMSLAYGTTAIAAWQGWELVVATYTASFVIGAALFAVLAGKEGKNLHFGMGVTMVMLVALQITVEIIWTVAFGGRVTPAAQQSIVFISTLDPLMCVKWIGIVLGIALMAWSDKFEVRSQSFAFGTLATGSALVIIGQIAGRYLFYAAMIPPIMGLY